MHHQHPTTSHWLSTTAHSCTCHGIFHRHARHMHTKWHTVYTQLMVLTAEMHSSTTCISTMLRHTLSEWSCLFKTDTMFFLHRFHVTLCVESDMKSKQKKNTALVSIDLVTCLKHLWLVMLQFVICKLHLKNITSDRKEKSLSQQIISMCH